MCDPVSIGVATFALSAGSQVLNHVGTNQQYAANEQAANLNYARDRDAIGRQDAQLQAERSEQVLDTAIAPLQARGDISASAADLGLSSSSISQQLNASMFGIGRNATIEERNFRNQRVELSSSRTDAELRRQSQINSRQRSSVAQLAIGVGQAGLSGYNGYTGARG